MTGATLASGTTLSLHTGETQITASVGTVHSGPVSITVTPGAESQLAIRTQPAGGASGSPLATQPVIKIRDAAGNLVTASTATVTATITTGGGSLAGSTATANGGIATFTALAVSGSVGDRTLTFTVSGLGPATSSGFAVGAGAPAKLVVRTEPTAAASGMALGVQPVVEVRDDADNLVSTSTATITAGIAAGGAGLTGGAVTAIGGIATFNGLTLTGRIGSHTLVFSSPGLASANSASFTLIAGDAALLRIRRQPGGAVSGQPFTTQPIIEITDTGGNLATSSSIVVSAIVASGGGSLTGGSVMAADGVATFTGLKLVGTAGQHALTFSATGLTPVTSASFNLSSGLPTQLSIRVQPAGAAAGVPLSVQPIVAVVDEVGNQVTNYSGAVTATIASGSGTVVNGVANVVNGVASFSGLVINGLPGTVTLTFRSGNLGPATSIPIAVLPGPGVRLVVRVSPPLNAPNGVPMTPQPVIEVQDANGNVAVSSVTVTLVTDAVSGTITNASATAVNGVATFSGLTLAGPLGARNYQFTAPGLTPTGFFRITITP